MIAAKKIMVKENAENLKSALTTLTPEEKTWLIKLILYLIEKLLNSLK